MDRQEKKVVGETTGKGRVPKRRKREGHKERRRKGREYCYGGKTSGRKKK